MKTYLIAAKAENNVIGKSNELIWKLPADFRRFKSLTTGHHLLMGRKTFESLGRPLPNRTHLVITRNKNYEVPEGHLKFESVEQAMIYCKKLELHELFVIGGGEIYAQTMNLADELMITEVAVSPDGDAFFPEIDRKIWEETSRQYYPADENHPYGFSFVNYQKINL